jgi:hypothetical protein
VFLAETTVSTLLSVDIGRSIRFGVLLAYGLAVAWRLQRVASSDATLLGAGALAGLVGFCSAAVIDLCQIPEKCTK